MSTDAIVQAVLASDAFSRRVTDIARPLARDALVGPQIAGLLEPGSVPQRAVRTPVVTALPRTPQEGDEVYYVAAGTVWHLIYLKRVSAKYPWVAVGGADLIAQVDAAETTASTTYVALTTPGPVITIPADGLYRVVGEVMHSNSAANVLDYMSFDIGATAAVDASAARGISTTSVGNVYVARTGDYELAAGTALTAKYKTGSGTATFERRLLTATPLKVG